MLEPLIFARRYTTTVERFWWYTYYTVMALRTQQEANAFWMLTETQSRNIEAIYYGMHLGTT